jgi:hypothetical protein
LLAAAVYIPEGKNRARAVLRHRQAFTWRGGMEPVGELTCPHDRRREDDLAGEQTVGGGRSEQPQEGVHQWAEQLPAVATAELQLATLQDLQGDVTPQQVTLWRSIRESSILGGLTGRRMAERERDWLRLPVVTAGSEHLVMGHLMRRNILTYKAPPGNEGYDLICIHPDPRHQPGPDEKAQIRVQVKSRYATDCDRGFPVREKSLDAFDYLIVAFLNIGNFYGRNDGSSGAREPEFYTLSQEFIRAHHDATSTWEKVKLKKLQEEIEPLKNEMGFELIAEDLGIPLPRKSHEPTLDQLP